MNRKLKILGTSLIAAFALAAVATTGAAAQQGFLTSDGPVTLTGVEGGEEPGYVEAFGVKVKCPGSMGTGHKYNVTPHELIANGATTFTATPHIKAVTGSGKMNCLAVGSFPMTTDFNGCDYVVHIGQTTAEDTYGGTTDIVCPPGQEIVWTMFTTEAEDPSTPFCTFHVKAQTGLTGITATDTTNGTIQSTGGSFGVHVTRTNHGSHSLLCPNNTTTNTAKIVGVGIGSGLNAAGEQTPISISHN